MVPGSRWAAGCWGWQGSVGGKSGLFDAGFGSWRRPPVSFVVTEALGAKELIWVGCHEV